MRYKKAPFNLYVRQDACKLSKRWSSLEWFGAVKGKTVGATELCFFFHILFCNKIFVNDLALMVFDLAINSFAIG